MEGDNRPLALNAWGATENSSLAAQLAVNAVVDPENDVFYKNNPQLTNFIATALHARILSQSDANNTQFDAIARHVSDEYREYVEGAKEPDELTGFLLWHEKLESIETGRRTHPRVWDTYEMVDKPIRDNLDESPMLVTRTLKSPPLYRIKNLNAIDEADKYFVQVDRKRTVRRHFGGRVLTIVRNSVVLHNTNEDDPLPRDIRKFIHEQRNDLRTNPHYDYDRHSDELGEHLESHLADRKLEDKPAWIIPLLTTYYAVKIEAVKAERLKKVEA